MDAGGWAERTNPDRPELRSRVLLEGMQRLGLRTANVASRDLRHGPEFLSWVRDSLRVELVSANLRLRGVPLLRPYVLQSLDLGGKTIRVGIAGVTADLHGYENAWPDSLGLEISDPFAAAREMLTVLEPQSDLQILLAALPTGDLERVSQESPGWDLLVCGTGDLREAPPVGLAPAVLSPGTKGKFLGWVALRIAPETVAIVEAGVPQLDAKVPDDPELASFVEAARKKFGLQPTGVLTPSVPAKH